MTDHLSQLILVCREPTHQIMCGVLGLRAWSGMAWVSSAHPGWVQAATAARCPSTASVRLEA